MIEHFPSDSVIQNKYLKWYLELCSHQSTATIIEKHHIVPRSFGGPDSASNIAKLSPRQHFVAHMLLLRCTKGKFKRSAAMAAHYMLSGCKKHCRANIATSRIYEILRKEVSEAMKNRIITEQHRQNMRLGQLGKVIPDDQKRKLSEKLSKQKAFIAFNPANEKFEGTDLRKFCQDNGISYHTARKIGNQPIVLTSGKNKGWVFTTHQLSETEVNHLRETELFESKRNRTKAIEKTWNTRDTSKEIKARTFIELISPDGKHMNFTTLLEVSSKLNKPASSLQNAKTFPYVFMNGAWAGWTLVNYETSKRSVIK